MRIQINKSWVIQAMLLYTVILTLLLAVAATNAMNLVNPDGVAYILIARHWREGQFDLAISGYWGPLLSWMILPFDDPLKPLQGGHVAMAISGLFFGLAGFLWLQTTLRSKLELTLGATILLFVAVSQSSLLITPDLLMSGWITLASYVISGRNWLGKTKWQLTAGSCFGLAYLSKAIALPLSVGVVVLFAVVLVRREHVACRPVLRAAAKTLMSMLVIAGPWIAALSIHYGAPTFSTSGPISHAILGPGQAAEHLFVSTYYPLPTGRVTTWEDPDRSAYVDWSPFTSKVNFVHQIRIVDKNIVDIINALRWFDPMGFGIIGSSIILISLMRVHNKFDHSSILSALAVFLLVCIYLPVYAFDTRYYLALQPFLIGSGFWVARMLDGRLGPLFGQIGASLLVFFLPMAHKQGGLAKSAVLSQQTEPSYVAALALSNAMLKSGLPPGGLISLGGNNWPTAYYMAFLLHTGFHGHNTMIWNSADLLPSGVHYIVVKATDSQNTIELTKIAHETGVRADDFVLYKLDTPR